MFNKIQSITNRKIIDSFSDLKALVEYIQSEERQEINEILKARKAGKGTVDYKNIKTTKLPCVIINFNHKDGYVNGATVTNSTGFMYFDVDNEDSLRDLDFSYVSAYWKSLSNNGFTIIIKAKGLTADNLKESYRYVGNILDLKYDNAAISVDRVTVLSYDPNAYFSNDTEVIDLTGIISKEKSTHTDNKNIFYLGYNHNGYKIRTDNLDEVIKQSNIVLKYNEDSVMDLGAENKLTYGKVVIPFQPIKEGKREKMLSTITHQLVSLNRTCSKKRVASFIHAVNKNKMQPSLKSQEVNIIINKKFKQRNDIKPFPNATRRILYNPNFSFSGKQKSMLALKTCTESIVKKSKEKIRTVLQNWDYNEFGKITQKKVIELTKMNKKTVSKYYTEILTELKISKNGS